jgi:hypothetical protein
MILEDGDTEYSRRRIWTIRRHTNQQIDQGHLGPLRVTRLIDRIAADPRRHRTFPQLGHGKPPKHCVQRRRPMHLSLGGVDAEQDLCAAVMRRLDHVDRRRFLRVVADGEELSSCPLCVL